MRIALEWTDNVTRLGLKDGFIANATNYPPLASACLWVFYHIFHPFGADFF